jgi:hypothetical protein
MIPVPRPPRIEVKGRLAALAGTDLFPHGRLVNALVAEERFNLPHTRLPPVVIAIRSR